MKHVMFDLETLDTVPGSVIVANGATEFDPYTGALGQRIYQVFDLQDQIDAGLTISGSTLQWWMSQSDGARQVFNGPEFRHHLDDGLVEFSVWLEGVRHTNNPDGELYLWGNGANFDNALLRAAAAKFDVDLSVSPFEDRCYRTLKNLFPDIKPGPRIGTHHNALDDAIFQAVHAVSLLREVRQPVGVAAW